MNLITLYALGWCLVDDPKPIALRMLVDGKPAGEGSYFHKVLPDGGKQILIDLKFALDGAKSVRVRSESVYDWIGNPVRKIQGTLDAEGRRIEIRMATFDEIGADLTIEKDGKSSTKSIELTRSAPRVVKSEFWFVRETPKKGDKSTFYQFDLNEARWKLMESVYEGPTTVEIGGGKVDGHRVAGDGTLAILDGKGWPIVIEIGKVRLERASLQNPAAPRSSAPQRGR